MTSLVRPVPVALPPTLLDEPGLQQHTVRRESAACKVATPLTAGAENAGRLHARWTLQIAACCRCWHQHPTNECMGRMLPARQCHAGPACCVCVRRVLSLRQFVGDDVCIRLAEAL